MGNSIVVVGGSKKAKVMKINGETFKLKAPVQACDVVKDYPGFVLLESNTVKKFGIRAKPLEPQQELMPRKIYFLVQLPKFPEEKVTRRVRSFVHTSAKARLEGLMLSRRWASDSRGAGFGGGVQQVKMRLPKAKLDKLVEESKDEAEVAEKIIHLFKQNCGEIEELPADTTLLHQQVVQWNHGVGGNGIR